MTQLLVIGFSKAIRGKGLSKNRPTCEKRLCIGAVWKLDAPGYEPLTQQEPITNKAGTPISHR